MTTYIIRRLIATVPVLFLISAITFFTIRLLPGDPALAILGPEADYNLVEALREELGLNRPVVVQYLDWMYHAFQGEFGESRRSGDTVAALVSDRLEVTIQLGILSLIVAVILALPIGLLAGSKPNTPFDYLGTFFAVVGAAIPNFWLALLLILVFAVDLGWFPALGFTSFREDPLENMRGMVLPAIAIGIAQAAVLARQTRASMVEVLQQDYVRTARSKGLRERNVIFRHGFRNAMIPVITILGLQISNIVSGAIIIESVFSLPGIGKLLIDSIFNRELVTVQALALMLALAVAMSNLLVDVSYGYIDPRIRYE
ncbi:MAG: ABC transporter permease [Chloroflexota bacterium]|nr:ABC transporter permease [Chloroflexota bacterium]MDE2892201.1 ABC transporter permease [Chloroflexota bacterium]